MKLEGTQHKSDSRKGHSNLERLRTTTVLKESVSDDRDWYNSRILHYLEILEWEHLNVIDTQDWALELIFYYLTNNMFTIIHIYNLSLPPPPTPKEFPILFKHITKSVLDVANWSFVLREQKITSQNQVLKHHTSGTVLKQHEQQQISRMNVALYNLGRRLQIRQWQNTHTVTHLLNRLFFCLKTNSTCHYPKLWTDIQIFNQKHLSCTSGKKYPIRLVGLFLCLLCI